jgi:hypothetical protein
MSRFCGLTRKHPSVESSTIIPPRLPNWVLRYSPRPGQWTKILPQPDFNLRTHSSAIEEPAPRYAAQVAYDPSSKTVFLHGGNAGPLEGADAEGAPEKRLDDLWAMTLVR